VTLRSETSCGYREGFWVPYEAPALGSPPKITSNALPVALHCRRIKTLRSASRSQRFVRPFISRAVLWAIVSTPIAARTPPSPCFHQSAYELLSSLEAFGGWLPGADHRNGLRSTRSQYPCNTAAPPGGGIAQLLRVIPSTMNADAELMHLLLRKRSCTFSAVLIGGPIQKTKVGGNEPSAFRNSANEGMSRPFRARAAS